MAAEDPKFDWVICECGCRALRPKIGEQTLDAWLYPQPVSRLFMLFTHDRPSPTDPCASNFYSLRGAEELLRDWLIAADRRKGT